MEEEYNWNLILKISLPVSAIIGYVFYTSISDRLKFLALVAGVLAASSLIYFQNKKKGNIFTGAAVVFLIALIVRFLKNFGLI